MGKLTAKLLFSGALLATLGAGLFLGFLMDYFLGWEFGASFFALESTDHQNYAMLACATVVASLSAFSFLRKKERKDGPEVVLLLLQHCITLTAVLIMGVTSYCILPSSVRNTVFGWGMTDFLSVFPGEAGLLRKTLTGKKPPSQGLLDVLSTPAPLIGSSWETRPGIRGIEYSSRANILVIHSFLHSRNQHTIAVFLTGVDEAAIEKELADDFWRYPARPVFSTRAQGLTLKWQDITYR